MSEARPLDLNYGHLGEPVYDSESHEWRFARVPHITRQLKPIGEPNVALASSSKSTLAGIPNAAERLRNIKDLENLCPELQPAGPLLSDLVQDSEIINEAQSIHDPIVSDLLAFGQIRHTSLKRKGDSAPVIAIAAGFAGEAVRLIHLTKELLGWERGKHICLRSSSCRGGEESLWHGNGSPIQQLVFGRLDGQPSSWLAVRYHGAISILRPQLTERSHGSKLPSASSSRSRLNPNLIVTLPIESLRGVPFADVAFNPWNNNQIATVDQDGHWAIWNIQGVATKRGLWAIAKVSSGSTSLTTQEEERSQETGDGWGATLWAGNTDMLVVASRRSFAVFDVSRESTSLTVPDLFFRKPADWILDMKGSPVEISHIFVVTSSTLFWLRVPASNESAETGAQCLLSWRHFRIQDICLRLNIISSPDEFDIHPDRMTTTILLYSRSNGLTTAFTLQHKPSSAAGAISTSDPFLLQLPRLGVKTDLMTIQHHHSHLNAPLSCIAMSALPYEFRHPRVPSGPGQLYFENKVRFYQLGVLTHDLSLVQSLYADVAVGTRLEIDPPDTRFKTALPKSSTKIPDDFILSDGSEDAHVNYIDEAQSLHLAPVHAKSKYAKEDACTINFEWLEESLRDNSGEAAEPEGFSRVLEDLFSIIKDKDDLGEGVTETLLGLAEANFSISDLERASLQFKDFLTRVTGTMRENDNSTDVSVDRRILISTILTPSMRDAVDIGRVDELLGLHDSLIDTWIGSLPGSAPSRVRIALEKNLRATTAQLCLASYATDPLLFTQDESENREKDLQSNKQFTLPVRRRTSVSRLKRGEEPVMRSSSPLASSQVSLDAGFSRSSPLRALPTPEPTPSLRSQSSLSSISSVAEDAASQRLQAYASLIPQPALPTKLSRSLDHWQLGADPAGYDWEAAQQAFASEDEDEVEVRAKERGRTAKRQKRKREPRVGGSQPGNMHGPTQDSSQATEGLATASQVEPGRFGGRPKKLKKRKAAGFK